MNRPLDSLLQREMSRKEFLMTLGFGLASIMGFSTLLHLFTGKSLSSDLHANSVASYGSSTYGGGQR